MNANVCIAVIVQLLSQADTLLYYITPYYIVILLIILTANLLIADKIMHIISNICANA